MAGSADNLDESDERPGEYQVVARRYRPQTFDELIGQQHVAKALKNAIATNRVGHAYLFTGARGVGKTSAARILAKALDCEKGPTSTPCNECDICQSIGTGTDVDVLEIDGASNNGVENVRELRANVNIRPARARFKIYIIDEVHMLSTSAFNALLKTLEEPPEHVKFIFCTTEANKIPITIRSRCQKFDFAAIRSGSIVDRLAQIVAAEGVTADPAALEMLARRANGSMRDSQSLLEQLLSFGEQHLTVADVNALLGTAGDARLVRLLQCLVERKPGGALAEVDAAIIEGVDVGQLLEQMLGYLRDCMAAAVGCPTDAFLFASTEAYGDVNRAAKELGLDTILAMAQIVEQTLGRLRFSTQGRMLLEVALVRMCALENLDAIVDLIGTVALGSSASVASATPQKKSEPLTQSQSAPASSPAVDRTTDAIPTPELRRVDTPSPSKAPVAFDEESVDAVWKQTLENISGMLFDWASKYERAAISAPNSLVVWFPSRYNAAKLYCERPQQLAELEIAATEAAGRHIKLEFRLSADPTPQPQRQPAVRPSQVQRARAAEKAEHPMVRRAMELFDAEVTRVEESAE